MADDTNDLPEDQGEHGTYEVGYGKPPKASRFKPGQSGNPKGRRKGSRNMRDIAREQLDQKHRVTVDGKVRVLTNREITVIAQVNKARKGDPKAFRELMALDEGLQQETASQAARVDLSAEERSILESHLAYVRNKSTEGNL